MCQKGQLWPKKDSGYLTYAKRLSHKHIGQRHFHASVFQTSKVASLRSAVKPSEDPRIKIHCKPPTIQPTLGTGRNNTLSPQLLDAEQLHCSHCAKKYGKKFAAATAPLKCGCLPFAPCAAVMVSCHY
jgi:hypothetical protein